jgi:hypothetical protein
MSPRDLVYVGHMLDMTRKALDKTDGITRDAYDAESVSGASQLAGRGALGRSQ